MREHEGNSFDVVQGTGTSEEMALEERTTISTEGCVIADVAVMRPPQTAAQAAAAEGQASTSGRGVPRKGTVEAEIADVPQRLHARVRVKTLAMWTDQGRLGQELCRVGLLFDPPSVHTHIPLSCCFHSWAECIPSVWECVCLCVCHWGWEECKRADKGCEWMPGSAPLRGKPFLVRSVRVKA